MPVANAADARTTVRPGMTIVPVSSVYDALTWLCSHGATDQVCSSLPTIHQRLATISSI